MRCTVRSLLLVTVLYCIAWPTLAAAEVVRGGEPMSFSDALDRCNSDSWLRVLASPSCIVTEILDLKSETGRPVALTILGIFFSILVWNAVEGYVRGPLISFVLFVLVLIGTIVVAGVGSTGPGPLGEWYVLHIFFSALAAGALSYWTKKAWELLPVAVAAGAVAVIVSRGDVLSAPLSELAPFAVGVAGGFWLYWRKWRGARMRRAGGRNAPDTPGLSVPFSADGGASGVSSPDGG